MGPTAPAGSAHTGIVATSPKAGARLEKVPKHVSITFSQEILRGTIVVRRAGVMVSRRVGGKDPSNVRRLRVAMKNGLGTGRFVVRWTITAADGHEQSGSFSFRVV
jgi:methionine-rich copper-binding protein CopC